MELKDFFSGNSMPFTGMGGFMVAIFAIWSLFWKGLALWRAARRGENVWFIVLMILLSFSLSPFSNHF